MIPSRTENPVHSYDPMSDVDFQRVSEMARAACGIVFPEGKRALVSSRLEKLVRRNGFASFNSYVTSLWQKKSEPAFVEFIDTLTTNHTGFWREPQHFLFLMKKIMALRPGRMRIWSAACSTGEEPYTIAMCALESGIANCRVAASDISRTVLAKAMRGTYDASKVRELPEGWPGRYFTAADGGLKTVTAAVRSLVDMGPLNLLQPFGHMGQFDVIFCRNVMIYFEQQTREELVARLAAQLTPGGYLFIGHSETLLKLPARMAYVQPATYRKS
ncbi:MAG TPA: protein-glutamate O-methyltransferase CheR [Bryobacteraceae bacterium]|jgi:chemotaxis protein methyltransferase CheR|nr:protein-glutamate O-methyltransferase CheR [Bryobacteraceae bacterium]